MLNLIILTKGNGALIRSRGGRRTLWRRWCRWWRGGRRSWRRTSSWSSSSSTGWKGRTTTMTRGRSPQWGGKSAQPLIGERQDWLRMLTHRKTQKTPKGVVGRQNPPETATLKAGAFTTRPTEARTSLQTIGESSCQKSCWMRWPRSRPAKRSWPDLDIQTDDFFLLVKFHCSIPSAGDAPLKIWNPKSHFSAFGSPRDFLRDQEARN